MFIKVTKSGPRRYAQLVESFRNTEGQPRQRTICTLGRLEAGGEVDTLISALQRARGFAPGAGVDAVGGAGFGAAASSAALQGLRFLDTRCAGDVWALWQLWRALGFDDLAGAWRASRSDIDVLACLRAMVFNRLCEPSSKLGVLRWLDTVALPLGFGFDDGAPQHQHLLRAMDVLDDHSAALGERLATLMRPLIDQELSVVFYDLTTVGVCGTTELAGDVRAYGRSKLGGVARQFVLSLVQTADGLPIAHEVHPGNTAETTTLLPMIKALLGRYPLKRVVLVADRGLLSVNNLAELAKLQTALAEQGRDVRLEYILAVPAARYGEFTADLVSLAAGQPTDQAWVGETTWQQQRLIVAHDPQAAARRTQARNKSIAELVALGQQVRVHGVSRRSSPSSVWPAMPAVRRQAAASFQPVGTTASGRGSKLGGRVLSIQATTALWTKSHRSTPWRRHVSWTLNPRDRKSSPRSERVGPEILRLSTMLRSACSAALLVGTRAAFVVKVHSAGHNFRMLAQVLAVRVQRFCWAPLSNAWCMRRLSPSSRVPARRCESRQRNITKPSPNSLRPIRPARPWRCAMRFRSRSK